MSRISCFPRWTVAVVTIILMIQNAAGDGFIYPKVDATTGFRAGDQIMVSWTSSFRKPLLKLLCGSHDEPLFSRAVSRNGSFELKIQSSWLFLDCYLELSQGSNHFSTAVFQLQTAAGPTTTWTASPTSKSPPSTNINVTVPGNAASHDPSVHVLRPNITLGSDGPASQYVWDDKDCLDNSDVFYPGCWEVLNITSWLPEWFLETPVCKPGQSEADCNLKNPGETPEPWTQTFLREAAGGAGMDCTIIGTNLCAYYFSSLDGAGDDPLLRARYKYVRYNIYMISGFFNSWYTAINTAMLEASLSINGIIDLVDPVKKTHVALNAILTALGIGLGFLPAIGPEFAALPEIAISAAKIALKGLQKAPTVAQQIWPVGSQDSQSKQIDALDNEIPSLLSELQNRIQRGLQLVQGVNQSDVSSFLAFTGDGNFSVSQGAAPTVEASTGTEVQPLLLAFTTYIVSEALSQNGWHALMLPGVNPAGLTNGTAGYPSWAGTSDDLADLHCSSYDKHGQCDGSYWYYSVTQNTAYTLNHNDKKSSTDIIRTIFSNGWATGSLLFENAAVCELQNMLQSVNASLSYTSLSGNAGFMFEGNLANLDPNFTTRVNETTSFLPINGGGLSYLSTIQAYADLLFHPKGTFWRFGAAGLDFGCTSQLNTSVANSWDGSWTKNSP